ncbi:MAG: flagellar basal-body rod protein FlgG [Gammaproteobacteria bacterium]|nr:MAG: flagellar basal-body rod protein FlgG [Gammaproteobacteria bacterium]TND06701.1 MAG: flagellar basal-body rod protein FlgG [Gammaproteobacteria bacterium]
MSSALWVAKTGLDAQQTRMAVISNNLANTNTTGFKRGRVVFEDLLYQNVRQVGAQSSQDTQFPSGMNLGTGVRVVATEKIFTQGNFIETGNSLDAAINGRGFFQILLPDGTVSYTRDGQFQVNAQGQIVNASGHPLQPAITVPANTISITIGTDGTISAATQGQAQTTQIGNIQVADFINPAGLQPVGQNLFLESAASGSPQAGTPGLNGLGQLQAGNVESSNINVVEELVNMIEAQRSYEMNSKAISATDRMLQFAAQQLG